jgi:hypothetical protein
MAAIGRVVVRPITKTTISAPNFTPKLNVAITDINNVNVSIRQDGDTLIYNAASGEYQSQPIQNAQIDIRNINGGRF